MHCAEVIRYFGLYLNRSPIQSTSDWGTRSLNNPLKLTGLRYKSASFVSQSVNPLTFGKENPTFFASLIPVFQLPPPMVLPLSSTPYSELGSPKVSQILYTWSISLTPGKSGLRFSISAKIVPSAHMSTGGPYSVDRSRTSGARYHLVETYSVYGGFDDVSLARPKSANLTITLTSFSYMCWSLPVGLRDSGSSDPALLPLVALMWFSAAGVR